jgi:1-acyl-sn-glycerol-3-phosphate acyltransferase
MTFLLLVALLCAVGNAFSSPSALTRTSVLTPQGQRSDHHPHHDGFFSSHNPTKSRQYTVASSLLYSSAATTASTITDPLNDAATSTTSTLTQHYPRWKATLVRTGMLLYIACMCLALPATLLPQQLVGRLISESTWPTPRRQRLALLTGQFCARQLLKLIPFCRIECRSVAVGSSEENSSDATATTTSPTTDKPIPTVWVCNHTSMLDVFLLLAADKRLRGKHRRPIQIVYWKDLEKNPITRLLFQQAGFIAVGMADNGHGNANEYDKTSFKQLLKSCKHSMAQGFDIGLLPEGQLNPTPERGLLPVFGGAQFLAKLAQRPIQFMAMHGAHYLWHPTDNRVRGRHVTAQTYWPSRHFATSEEFAQAFTAVVGEFGKRGQDLPVSELQQWLLGSDSDSKTSNNEAATTNAAATAEVI